MNKDIPGIDRSDLSVYAFAHMYRAMKQAEQAAVDVVHNSDLMASSGVSDRGRPTVQDIELLISDNKWYIAQSEMYAMVYLAAEMADDSPRRNQFQQAMKRVDAFLSQKLIPRQRSAQ